MLNIIAKYGATTLAIIAINLMGIFSFPTDFSLIKASYLLNYLITRNWCEKRCVAVFSTAFCKICRIWNRFYYDFTDIREETMEDFIGFVRSFKFEILSGAFQLDLFQFNMLFIIFHYVLDILVLFS